MKEKLKMLLVTCIIISMLVTSPATAFATVVTTTGTPATGYRVYHDIEDWGVLPDVEMTYFTMEGRTAFCIEAGGAIRGVSGNYQPGVENNIDVDYAISTITEDNSVQSQVAYLGYYSLDNPTMRDYVFTQMMIWQCMPEWYANGINSATGEYRSYFIDSTIRAEYETWKAKIQKKIDTWESKPSFNGTSKYHVITAGETLTLNDTDRVFEDYNAFSYTQDGITITHLEGSNSLRVEASKDCKNEKVIMVQTILMKAGAVKYDSKATANYIYASDNSQDIGVYGTTDPVPLALSFSVQTLGSLKIIKASEGKLISGITFNVEKTDGTYTATVKTGADGTVTLADIPTGEYEISEVTPSGYVKHDTVTVTVEPAATAIADFENELQKGKIAMTKKGSVFSGFTKTSQGIYKPSYTSANLAGAVYDVIAADDFKAADGTILQKKGTVVDTLTTGSNGRDTTNEIYLGTYILKEKVPPTGYVLDETEYTVTLTYAGEEKDFTTVSKTLVDKRQQVNVSLKKAMELDPYGQLTPETVDDVTFGLYADENLYVNGSTTEYIPKDGLLAVLDVNKKGTASYTGNLPAGRYYVKEIATNNKYIVSSEKYTFVAKYDNTGNDAINISINNGNAIENEYIKCSVKVIKKNNETGNLLKGVFFKLYSQAGTEIAEGYTNHKGILEFTGLPIGTYILKEEGTITGYVVDKTEKTIVLTKEKPSSTLTINNALQKGKITLTKQGNVFTGFIQNDQGVYVPTYTKKPLAGAVYEVVAAEDFKAADGRVLQKKGAVVDTLTTGADGKAITKEIYLGKYIVKEKMPPTGYILDATEHEVELVYAGEQVAVAASTKTVIDDRQQVNISLIKTMEIDPYGQLLPEMVDNVSFGLYTEEDIYTHDGGAFIPADSLMWVLDVDEKGRASYRGNLPEGRYYLKEVVTDPHYILSEEKYPIELRYDKTGKEFIDIVANGGDAIENEYVKCSLNIIKSDEETGALLEGTGFKLFNEREEEIAQGYTDEKGFLEFDELPVGEYKVREFEASSGYLINQEERHITLTQQQISQDVQVENQIKVGIIGAVMRLGPESMQEMVIVPKTEDITGILFWLMLAGGSFFCIVYVLWILNRGGRIKGKEYKKKEYQKKEKRFVIPVMLAIVLAFTGTFSSITAMAASRITRVYEFVSQTEDFQYTDNQNIVIDEEEYHAVDISYEIIAEIEEVEDVPSIEKKKNKHVEKTKIEEKEKEVESEKVEEKLLPVTSVKVWEGCRQKPQIPESMVVYTDDEEGKKIETRVFLDKVEERESRNKSTFEIDAEFIGDKDCQYYLMGDMRVKVNPEEPTFQGYEEALLNYLHLDSQIYTITGGLWLGDFEQKIETGETVRYARFLGEARDLVDYTVYYKGSIPMWETTDFEAETTDIEVETAVPESEIIDDKVTKTDIDEETERSKKYLVQATVTYEKDSPSIDYNVVKAVPLFLLVVIIVATVTIFNLKRKVPAAT